MVIKGKWGKAGRALREIRASYKRSSPNLVFLMFPTSLCITKEALSLESLEIFLLLGVILVEVTRAF